MNYQPRTISDDSPIIQLVSKVLLEAYQCRASDIHWEPIKSGLQVRFRIDGILQEAQHFPKKLQNTILSRLKIMTGSMNIGEKRLPQDGRFQKTINGCVINFRVSTIPTLRGESIVIRLLEHASLLTNLTELGLCQEDQAIIKKLLHRPDGLILVTGPTGSGKTTTLYAFLKKLNQADCKIITVEDPVEYQIPGINQVQLHEEIGRTFPVVLRSILRQAPNKIMIGEIRDLKTAQSAVNASLTGHLVFSTLHTNDAPSAMARLFDLGIPSFLLASSLRGVIAQRLVRRLCSHCKMPTSLTDYEKKVFGDHYFSLEKKITPMKAVGCKHCHGSGFQGRLALFEILVVNDLLSHQIHRQSTATQLRSQAREQGMRTLREDGLRKMFAGLTTAAEVLSITSEDMKK